MLQGRLRGRKACRGSKRLTLPRKLRLSLEYARRRNLLSDLGVILRTLATVLVPTRPRQAERIATGVPPTDPPGATANKGSRQ